MGREKERQSCGEGGLLRSSLSSANPMCTAACHMASGSALLSVSSLGIHMQTHTSTHALAHSLPCYRAACRSCQNRKELD